MQAEFHFTREDIEELIARELKNKGVKINSYSYKTVTQDIKGVGPPYLVKIVVYCSPTQTLDTV